MGFLKKFEKLGLGLYDDHKIPTSRRDFLSCGALSMAYWAAAPSLALMSNKAAADILACANSQFGADCGVPYLCFEGAGGMNIAGGNVSVGFDPSEGQEIFQGTGGSINLTDYFRLGLPTNLHPSQSGMLNRDYGLVFHSTSGLLAGLNEVLTGDVDISKEQDGSEMTDLKKSIDGLFICVRTGDDSSGNPTNTAHMARQAGSFGKLIQIIGSDNSDTGARSTSPQDLINLNFRPSRVSSFADGRGLLSISDTLMNNNFLDVANVDGKGTERIREFMSKISVIGKTRLEKMSQEKTQKITNSIQGVQGLFEKYGPAALDPTATDTERTIIQGAFGGAGMNVMDQGTASVANLVINRFAGSGSLVIGGCDYHNGTATSGASKDQEIGRLIGKSIKLAAIKKRPLFIHLYTDGGVAGDAGGTIDASGRVVWRGDSGTRNGMMLLVYKPGHDRDANGSLIIKSKKSNGQTRERQLGHFTQNSAAINLTSTSVANNAGEVWKAIMLNYIASMSTSTDDDAIIVETMEKFKSRFPGKDLPPDAADLIRFRSLIV